MLSANTKAPHTGSTGVRGFSYIKIYSGINPGQNDYPAKNYWL